MAYAGVSTYGVPPGQSWDAAMKNLDTEWKSYICSDTHGGSSGWYYNTASAACANDCYPGAARVRVMRRPRDAASHGHQRSATVTVAVRDLRVGDEVRRGRWCLILWGGWGSLEGRPEGGTRHPWPLFLLSTQGEAIRQSRVSTLRSLCGPHSARSPICPSLHRPSPASQVEVVDAAGRTAFEPLILFTHREPAPARPSPYLRLTLIPVLGSGPGLSPLNEAAPPNATRPPVHLTVTPRHAVWASPAPERGLASLLAAAHVVPGEHFMFVAVDGVLVAARVASVEHVMERPGVEGLYNYHTLSGRPLVVDGAMVGSRELVDGALRTAPMAAWFGDVDAGAAIARALFRALPLPAYRVLAEAYVSSLRLHSQNLTSHSYIVRAKAHHSLCIWDSEPRISPLLSCRVPSRLKSSSWRPRPSALPPRQPAAAARGPSCVFY